MCKENAENALRNSLTLEATNVIAEKLLEEVTGQGNSVHKRQPKEFVAELFDSFADTFDEKLDSLEYRVPSIIGNMVKKLETKFSAVLDAGCGTGLVGRFVKSICAADTFKFPSTSSASLIDILDESAELNVVPFTVIDPITILPVPFADNVRSLFVVIGVIAVLLICN